MPKFGHRLKKKRNTFEMLICNLHFPYSMKNVQEEDEIVEKAVLLVK